MPSIGKMHKGGRIVEREQTKMIVRKLSTLYGNQFKLEDDPKFVIDTWHEILKDYDFDRVSKNLITHSINSDFLPKPKDLVKGLVMDEKYNIPGREETLKIIETYQVPEEQRATPEQRQALRKKYLGR